MLKSITTTGAAVAALVTACVLLPKCSVVLAQSAPLYISAVEYDIVPGQIENFLAALKENGAASVKEPGCRELDIAISQKDPNHVFIFEVYESAAAAEAHTATEHFKKYKAITKDMVARREAKLLWSVAMNAKGM
jgi:(4S)-4-hydroxy-5-phosphonooxypentane-2,3-dione isomerase